MLTPYQFAANSPIAGIDFDGLEYRDFRYAAIGQTIGGTVITNQNYEDLYDQQAERVKEAETPELKMARYTIAGGLGFISSGPAMFATTQYGLSSLVWIYSHPVEITVAGGMAANAIDPNPNADWIPGMPLDDVGNLAGQGIRYLFRGTTKGFAGGAAAIKNSATFTSLDPLKSTIFALFARNKGKPVLLASTIDDLAGTTVKGGNRLAEIEKEVILEMQPLNFVETSIELTLGQAKSIFAKMGIKVPDSVDDISKVLKETPNLKPEQIETFYKEAAEIGTRSN